MCSCTIPSVLIFSALFDQGLLMVFPNGEISVYSTYIYVYFYWAHIVWILSALPCKEPLLWQAQGKKYIVKAILFVGHNRQ